MSELRQAILDVAKENNWNPVDIATIMSYETGGTMDPWQKGPTTQHGTHRGLIQWGEPQARKYGVTKDTPVRDQVYKAAQYLKDRGVKPGDGILPIYAAINAGHASKVNASDAHNGGAPGTVMDKVRDQMHDHRTAAERLLGVTGKPEPQKKNNEGEYKPLEMKNVELPTQNAKPVQEAAPTSDSSLWELQKDAYNVEQTLPWLLQGTDQAPDPEFALSSDKIETDLNELGADIVQYAPVLGEATSAAHYQEQLERVKQNQERVKRLEEAGLTGSALRIANSILDPVALGAEIGASILVPGSGLAVKSSRTTRLAQGALAGGAAGYASTAVNERVNPNVDQSDLLMGTIFGAGIGTVVGTLQRGKDTVAEAALLSRSARRTLDEYEAVPVAPGSVGAARAPANENYLNDEAFEFLEHKDIAETFGKGVRFDLSAMLDKSKNPLTRMLGGLVQDGVGKKGGAINAIAPSEERMLYREEWLTAAHRTYNPAFSDYLKDNGVGVLERRGAENKFNEEIDDYIRDRRVDREGYYHPAVVRVGNKLADLQAQMLNMAKNPRLREGQVARSVKGFADVPEDKHYMTRFYDPQKVISYNREFEPKAIQNLIYGSVRSANPQMPDELAQKIAKGFSKNLIRRSHGLDDFAVREISEDTLDDLAEELELDAHGTTVLKDYFAPKGDKGRDPRAKRRVLMDENYRLSTVLRKDGTRDDKGFGLNDLIKKDAMGTFSRYADQMAGMVALARYRFKDPQTGEMLVDGITSDAEFRQLINQVRKRGADLIAEGEMTQAKVDIDVERLEFAYSTIRGRPVFNENNEYGWWSRALRKYNFSRIMNQVGFAQLAEVGVTIGHLGVKASFSQVPALRRMINQDGETILKSGLADDLEQWLGVGTDRLRATSDYRYDDLVGVREDATGTFKDKVEHTLNVGNRVTSELSGMMQVNTMLQRWTNAAILQKFANFARTGKGMPDERWADLGIDKEMRDRISKMLTTDGNVEYEQGFITGKKVARIHPDKWDDAEAAETMRTAIYRLSNQLIQKNDIGNLAMWMSRPTGKMFMQFRTFMVGAYGKQTLKAMNFKDRQAFTSIMLSMAAGGAAYVAQKKVQALGREDQRDFERKNLSWDKIGTAAFARTGASSIIPMLIDTGRYIGSQDAAFGHTRTSGQVSNLVFGNPVFGGFDDLTTALRAGGDMIQGDHSQEQVRQIMRAVPFGNSIPVVMGANSLIGDLPRYAPKD